MVTAGAKEGTMAVDMVGMVRGAGMDMAMDFAGTVGVELMHCCGDKVLRPDKRWVVIS